ncbi:MAG: pyruvate kinase [Anaerolineaceae bacterium]|nr:pyruvate kinase [Anaerolineaceae bacterium]
MDGRNAKIVATLGPSCQSEDSLKSLIEAGLDVARLNFSHGTHEYHANLISLIRKLSVDTNKPITILQDLQGPKLRVGDLPPEGITLSIGQSVTLFSIHSPLSSSGLPNDGLVIPMDIPDLAGSVSPGNHILLDDGHLEMEITAVTDTHITARVTLGGILTSHKGVNFPGAKLDIPGFTEKDRQDLAFGLEQNVDAVAISFVRTPQDVLTVRDAIQQMDKSKADLPIIAKLERPEAIQNLEAILDVADGVMVARGDLGVETSPAGVPIMQKRIIRSANQKARMVITATQMLDSMINNPRPTRAEASDVANAVFDGSDAVMLSGETASGKYPLESVMMMDAIVREAEQHFKEWGQCESLVDESFADDAISMTRAARELAHDRNVSAIAVFTLTGRTALLMSKIRPQVPILAFTPEQRTLQRLGLYWGVTPYLVPYASSVENMIDIVEQVMMTSTPLQPGQQVIIITGLPVGAFRQPNFALLHTLGENIK